MADEEPPAEEAKASAPVEEAPKDDVAAEVGPSEEPAGDGQRGLSKIEEEPAGEPREAEQLTDEAKIEEGAGEEQAEDQTEEQTEYQIEDQPELPEEGVAEEEEFRKSSSIFPVASDELKKDELESKQKVAERKKIRALGSVISIRRGREEYYDRAKAPRYMNSYKLDSDKPFNSEKVENILKDVLTEALENLSYDSDNIPKQAKWASSAIRAKVKEQEYDRYKIVCMVTIGEKRCEDLYTILRFLWDVERDRFSKYVHETVHLFAVGLCFGIYYE